MDKELKNAVTSISDKAKYDECAKQLLAQKHILAHILIKTVDAFKGMNANDVVQYIEGEPYISTVPVEPGSTNQSQKDGTKIVGLNTENAEINEGMIRFDIIFYVRIPSETDTQNALSQIIINVEAQKDEPTKYKILNRAIFYISRLISSQKQRDFVNTNYDDIKQVYSIWVCMGMEENTMCHINLTKNDLIGFYDWRGDINIPNIVMIGLSDTLPEHDETYELHRLLSALFSDKLSVTEKIEIIDKEYNIPVDNDIQEGVSSMCNLGQGIEDRAIEKGIENGIAKGETIAKMNIILNMYNNNFTIEQIALATQYNVDEVKDIIAKNNNN